MGSVGDFGFCILFWCLSLRIPMGSGGDFRICVLAMFCEKSVENLFGELRCAQEVSYEGVDEVCVKIGVEGVEPQWARMLLWCRGWRVTV